jgi:hypothetical protein
MNNIITINADDLVTAIMAVAGIITAFAVGYIDGKHDGRNERRER